jgi:hypothetical protein
MKIVHVECKPDEQLVFKLGVKRSSIIHHSGKSRVFKALGKESNQIAMVDEDPNSNKTSYEKSLKLIEEHNGIKLYKDSKGNTVLILKGKLEDWIINCCGTHTSILESFNLPKKPNSLHSVIIIRLKEFEKLIEYLLSSKNTAVLRLKSYLALFQK